jgi:iron-sulfur cluster assembly accessory protein
MITITESAAKRISEIREEDHHDAGLRVFVRGGGCSGFQYGMEIEQGHNDGDQVFESHGVRVFIDPISISYLRGATIEFNDFKGGFTISNPNATSTCGCGSSFTSDAQR